MSHEKEIDTPQPRILLIHGVGDVSADDWQRTWSEVLTTIFKNDQPDLFGKIDPDDPDSSPYHFCDYHDLLADDFKKDALTEDQLTEALRSLSWSVTQPVSSGIEDGAVPNSPDSKWDSWSAQDNSGSLLRRSGGLNARVEALYWTAGMIVRWCQDSRLRKRLRDLVAKAVEKSKAEVIAAHSMGALIAYDLFQHEPELVRDRSFVSFGTQLGNAYVRNVFFGRLRGLPTAKYWLHLYNPCDACFTAEIRLHGKDLFQDGNTDSKTGRRNFHQVYTPFDNPDPLDNTAVSTGKGTVGYLDSYEARQMVWPRVFEDLGEERSFTRRLTSTLREAISKASRQKDNRALLIGVDHYIRPDIPDLSGCCNDTFLMSKVLQEQGFPAQNIRILQNERATSSSIRDRLEWLLDDVDDGEFRFLFFSGHGHQLESYGPTEVVDRLDECLCPADYDYSVRTAILDDHIFDLYCQLPYGAQFVAILDCCHAGGMARSGSSKVRGLTAPMDVAHRGLKWQVGEDGKDGLWLRRAVRSGPNQPPEKDEFAIPWRIPDRVQRGLAKGESEKSHQRAEDLRSQYVGEDETLRRIFRGLSVRRTLGRQSATSNSSNSIYAEMGPYLPVILQACKEGEVALEHTDGLTSYGAFTFALSRGLRELKPFARVGDGKKASDENAQLWPDIIAKACQELDFLGYKQNPQLLQARQQKKVIFQDFHSQKHTKT